MSPIQIVVMVVGILAAVAGVNAAIWLPLMGKMKRLPEEVRREVAAAGETIDRGPERGTYRGATAQYGKVRGLGMLTLTNKRLMFRKVLGQPVDVPTSEIVGVREDRWFLGGATVQMHLVVKLKSGIEVAYYVNDHQGWMARLGALGAASALPVADVRA